MIPFIANGTLIETFYSASLGGLGEIFTKWCDELDVTVEVAHIVSWQVGTYFYWSVFYTFV